jgi:hypothetical protein
MEGFDFFGCQMVPKTEAQDLLLFSVSPRELTGTVFLPFLF